MILMTGKIVGPSEIVKNLDGERETRMVQVQLSDENDIQSAELFTPFGDDYDPPLGLKVLIFEVQQNYKIAIATDHLIAPQALEGERYIFSFFPFDKETDEEYKLATQIKLLNTGDIESTTFDGTEDNNPSTIIKQLNTGDIELKTFDGTEEKSFIKLSKDGIVKVNGDADFAVRFTELETEFNKLRDAWDDFANAYVAGGPGTQGLPAIASASGADISGAKVEEVTLP